MKLAVASLVLVVAFVYAVDSVNGKSRKSHEKEISKRYQYVTVNCPSVTVDESSNGGQIVYTGAMKREKGSYCNILISGPPGVSTHLDVYMENAGGNMFPDCTDGGQLSIYSGADATGSVILRQCDALPMKSYNVRNNKIFIDFTKDKVGDNFVVQFRFTSSRRSESDLLEQLDEAEEKKTGDSHHHGSSRHHHKGSHK